MYTFTTAGVWSPGWHRLDAADQDDMQMFVVLSLSRTAETSRANRALTYRLIY